MKASRMLRTLDIHVSGWPLRVVFDAAGPLAGERAQDSPAERAEFLWSDERASVRWLQREPRGHAAMRIGVLGKSARVDYSLLVFDADGPCEADLLDVLGAAGALTETGMVPGADAVTFETKEGIMIALAENERGLRAISSVVETGKQDCALLEASVFGVALRPENAARIEKELRGGAWRKRKVILFVGAGAERTMAVLGRDGRLLRAPGGAAIGALVSHFYGKEWRAGESVRLRGLAGGVMEVVVISEEFESGSPSRNGMAAKLHWELRARARLIGSCEFLLDSRDPHGEGFLLRRSFRPSARI